MLLQVNDRRAAVILISLIRWLNSSIVPAKMINRRHRVTKASLQETAEVAGIKKEHLLAARSQICRSLWQCLMASASHHDLLPGLIHVEKLASAHDQSSFGPAAFDSYIAREIDVEATDSADVSGAAGTIPRVPAVQRNGHVTTLVMPIARAMRFDAAARASFETLT